MCNQCEVLNINGVNCHEHSVTHDLEILRVNDELTIWVPESVEDVSLERQQLMSKSDMMTDVLGLVVQLKQGRPATAKA